MTSTHKRHFLGTLAAVAVAAAIGVALGFLLEGAFVLKSAGKRLDKDAWRLVAEVDAIQGESHALLGALNSSPYPSCSEAEAAWVRKLIFHSVYWRDAGRMVDGRIICSADLGRENLPRAQFKPSVTLADGTSLYNHFAPYETHGEGAVGQKIGDVYVVMDNKTIDRFNLITKDRAISSVDAVTHKTVHPFHQLPITDGVVSDTNWQGRVGKWLMVTRCSANYPTCMTTYANLPEILTDRFIPFMVYAALGGMTGALFGFACFLLHRRRISLAQQLRRAIRKDKLWVVYQPIVQLSSGRITGAEALVRWKDEEGFPVGPDVFVKIAEERGFVGEITRLVVRHALHDFRELLLSRPEFHLSVNVAAADLSDDRFLPMLEETLKLEGVPAQSLAVEITETSTAHSEKAKATIKQLRERGFSLHIDDFGTGYSSLSYLHALAIDAIKIDKSFTQAIGTEAVTVSILPQILSMAATLKLQVIVEGVETKAQSDYFLAASQPVLAQGWYFGRPVSIEQFQSLLDEERKTLAAESDSAELSHVQVA